ncbi:predicted protein [Botrytis cinerea T4]|uniref:Uncharacterized protein n=1 Tax=Botryotinia fuckeliana (strain T4) TaxID=999810 RepID=G2XPH8_BOTF4|nr:predicted protein [Botrytis cinerea T4]
MLPPPRPTCNYITHISITLGHNVKTSFHTPRINYKWMSTHEFVEIITSVR